MMNLKIKLKSGKNHILSELTMVISWWIVLSNYEILSIAIGSKPKTNFFWIFPYYLCEMSCLFTKNRIIEVIVFDFVIPRLSCWSTFIISWRRSPHVVKILSIISVTVLHLCNRCQMLSPYLRILVELFIKFKWRSMMFLPQFIMFWKLLISKGLHVIVL